MTETNSSLQQIENLSLSEQAASILRRAILNGQFKPGDALNETELADQLGTSRAPIREALRILSTEGLTDTIAYQGTRVRSFTRRDIEELYSMRVLMETFAVQRIIAQDDPTRTKPLHELLEHMVAAAETNDLRALNEADRAFHDALIVMSEHHLMASLWQMVAMRVQQIMALNNRRFSNLTDIAHNHRHIIEAIEAGDTELACTLLEEHIVSAGDMVVEGWQPTTGDNSTDDGASDT